MERGDGRFIYFSRAADNGVQVFRVEVESGRRTLWKEISPSDPAGASVNAIVHITPDGKSYAYGVSRQLSQLYLVEGLK